MNTPAPSHRLAFAALASVLLASSVSAQDPAPETEVPVTPPAQAEPDPAQPDPPAPETPEPLQPEPGDEVTVEYKDGRRLTGVLVTQDEHAVTIRITGIDVDIPRPDVSMVTRLGTPLERYRQMRPAIPNDDAVRIITLVKWLQSYKLYREGLAEIELAIRADPTNAEAWRLKRELESQVEILENEDGDAPDDSLERERRREAGRNHDQLREKIKAASQFDLLSEDQIGLMKVYEINLNDPPTIRISHDTVKRFMQMYVEHPLVPDTRAGREAFHRKSPEEILDIMFRARARDFYSEVEIIGDPEAIRIFRDRVQAGWLVNNCATSRCHGGPDVGDLWLVNTRPRSDAATYTNLLILERTTLPDGTPLIDYERPGNSALLQLGLPPDDSARPHPEVVGWRPAFRSRDARAYSHTVSWINAMYRPRPDYSIDYVPPALRRIESPEKPEKTFEPVER